MLRKIHAPKTAAQKIIQLIVTVSACQHLWFPQRLPKKIQHQASRYIARPACKSPTCKIKVESLTSIVGVSTKFPTCRLDPKRQPSLYIHPASARETAARKTKCKPSLQMSTRRHFPPFYSPSDISTLTSSKRCQNLVPGDHCRKPFRRLRATKVLLYIRYARRLFGKSRYFQTLNIRR